MLVGAWLAEHASAATPVSRPAARASACCKLIERRRRKLRRRALRDGERLYRRKPRALHAARACADALRASAAARRGLSRR